VSNAMDCLSLTTISTPTLGVRATSSKRLVVTAILCADADVLAAIIRIATTMNLIFLDIFICIHYKNIGGPTRVVAGPTTIFIIDYS
jgi:hypothetical protein